MKNLPALAQTNKSANGDIESYDKQGDHPWPR